jgi:hypothetical protein
VSGPHRPPRSSRTGELRRRVAADPRIGDAARRLEDGAVTADGWMIRIRRHSRVSAILASALVLVVFVSIVVTAGGDAVEVSSAAEARETALELRPGLRSVSCVRDDSAWQCTATRKGRPWTCRVFLRHTKRQALTGSCRRVPRAG